MRPVMATSSVLSETLRSMPTGWLSRSLTRRYSVTASRTRRRHAADCSGSRKPTSIHDERTSSATPAGRALGRREVPEVAQGVVGRDADRGVRALRAGLRARTVEVLHAVAPRAVEPREQPRRRAGVERRGHAREGRLLSRSRRHADTLRPARDIHPTTSPAPRRVGAAGGDDASRRAAAAPCGTHARARRRRRPPAAPTRMLCEPLSGRPQLRPPLGRRTRPTS